MRVLITLIQGSTAACQPHKSLQLKPVWILWIKKNYICVRFRLLAYFSNCKRSISVLLTCNWHATAEPCIKLVPGTWRRRQTHWARCVRGGSTGTRPSSSSASSFHCYSFISHSIIYHHHRIQSLYPRGLFNSFPPTNFSQGSFASF